jgi:hypothetical protein
MSIAEQHPSGTPPAVEERRAEQDAVGGATPAISTSSSADSPRPISPAHVSREQLLDAAVKAAVRAARTAEELRHSLDERRRGHAA